MGVFSPVLFLIVVVMVFVMGIVILFFMFILVMVVGRHLQEFQPLLGRDDPHGRILV